MRATESHTRRHFVRALLILCAWLPFVLLWALFAAGDRGALAALGSGFTGVAPAAALSAGVWNLCRRIPWPARLNLSFYFSHLGLALVYAVSWVAASRVARALELGHLIPREFFSSRITIMHVLTGVALYGVIAGVSYAILIRMQLHEKEQLAAHAQTLAVRARLEALSARLNPHFLFNALHTLSALSRYEPDVTPAAVERLADMLRYVLKREDATTVRLRNEWAFSEMYLDFQRLRFGDRLRVRARIEDAAHNRRIPSFALQTLIENSVLHAIESKTEGGTIEVSARVDRDLLVLVVRNDMEGHAEPSRGHGSGLTLLRERLDVLYQGSATMHMHRTPDAYEVTLRIPEIADDELFAEHSA
jgi:sensor histidine kinase YesM